LEADRLHRNVTHITTLGAALGGIVWNIFQLASHFHTHSSTFRSFLPQQ